MKLDLIKLQWKHYEIQKLKEKIIRAKNPKYNKYLLFLQKKQRKVQKKKNNYISRLF